MPELAEVERAKNNCAAACEGKTIAKCLSREDTIVYSGTTHDEFARSVMGKKIQRVGRLGKYFYIILQSSPHIVMHLGMAGFVSTRGNAPLFYRKKAKNLTNEDGNEWPLRYWKFSLEMDDGTEWCFCDSRRLGRIRLVDASEHGEDVTKVEPLSLLGRDPYMDMPSLEDFSAEVLRRKAPIKALLLNQNGPLSGIGNYLIDEISYQARIHPGQRSNTLSSAQLEKLHTEIQTVVNKVVEVNADHKLFPTHWLFSHRWSKGKSKQNDNFVLDDGTIAKIVFDTVGGRTTAIVEGVQVLPDEQEELSEDEGEPVIDDDKEDKGDELEQEAHAEDSKKRKTPSKSRPKRAAATPKKTPNRKAAKTPGTSSRKPRGRKVVKDENASDSDLSSLLTSSASEDSGSDYASGKKSSAKKARVTPAKKAATTPTRKRTPKKAVTEPKTETKEESE